MQLEHSNAILYNQNLRLIKKKIPTALINLGIYPRKGLDCVCDILPASEKGGLWMKITVIPKLHAILLLNHILIL